MIFLTRNLVFLLKKYGATQSQLAAYAGVSQNSISNWINEVSSPNVAVLVKIHQFFGISLDALILADIEKSGLDLTENIEEFKRLGVVGDKNTGKVKPVLKSYFKDDDSNASIVSEPDPVVNWAVMGQFKEVHHKLDIILQNTEPKKGAKK